MCLMVFGRVVYCLLYSCLSIYYYVNGLLCKLKDSGVECHFGCEFVGSVCYADDLALLALSPSALRIMLIICDYFARDHGLKFNAAKTQLIRFSKYPCSTYNEIFRFCGIILYYPQILKGCI